jgi:hypothetical protein
VPIGCEEDRTLCAVLVGMLREAERWGFQISFVSERRMGRRTSGAVCLSMSLGKAYPTKEMSGEAPRCVAVLPGHRGDQG